MLNFFYFRNLIFVNDFFYSINFMNIFYKINLKFYIWSWMNEEFFFLSENYFNLKDDYIFLKADYENYKKRSDEELSRSYKYAIEDISSELLSVIDSLEFALNDKFNKIEKILEGVRLTLKILLNILKKNNISVIFPGVGDVFDPKKHEAIFLIDCNKKKDFICNLLQKGYIISNRILRPALVSVNR